jgi:hypothetical protein
MRQHSLRVTLQQEVESKGYEKKEKRGKQHKTPVRQKISRVKL